MSNDETKTPADAESQELREQDQDKTLFYELLAEMRL